MAITRKGWRKIVVDGLAYKWRVTKEANYFDHIDNIGWANMRFTVESASGALLIVELNRPRLDYWLYPELKDKMKPVTPHEVAAGIRGALSEGWEPTLKAKPFIHKGV